jgi:hypothetical protein
MQQRQRNQHHHELSWRRAEDRSRFYTSVRCTACQSSPQQNGAPNGRSIARSSRTVFSLPESGHAQRQPQRSGGEGDKLQLRFRSRPPLRRPAKRRTGATNNNKTMKRTASRRLTQRNESTSGGGTGASSAQQTTSNQSLMSGQQVGLRQPPAAETAEVNVAALR